MTATHSLTLYRRHSRKCEATGESEKGTCDCTIWVSGRVTPNSEPIRQSLKTSDVVEANRAIDDLARGVVREPKRGGVTVRAAVDLYFIDQEDKDRKLSAGTLRSYRLSFKAFCEVLGDYLVADITTETIRAFRKQHRDHIAATTWNHDLFRLRTFFAWCAKPPRRWILADMNPTDGVPIPAIAELVTPPFDNEEVQRIMDACSRICVKGMRGQVNTLMDYSQRRAKALVYVLLYSGLRISDIAELTRAALNLETRHLSVRTIKSGRGGERKTQVKVRLPAEAVDALLAMPSKNTKYFFWTGESSLASCITVLYHVVTRLGELAGVPDVHPHRFRDTFACGLLTKGKDIRQVQQLLGHKSVRTTEKHYAHFINAHQALLDEATASLDFGLGANRNAPVLVHTRNRRSGNA